MSGRFWSSRNSRWAASAAAAAGIGVPLAVLARRRRLRPGHPYFAGAPLLMAHRGGAELAPENTLVAFERAVRWWHVDVLELDVHATRDGEVVVIHDDTVDRTTDGSGAVRSRSLDELQRLDAGYRFTPDGGRSFPFRGRSVRIPTLREVLTALPDVRVNVEIKDARAQDAVWDLVHAHGATRRVLIAAINRPNRARFGTYPGAVSAARQDLYAFYALHWVGATGLLRPSLDAFQMPERYQDRQVLTPRLLRAIQALNIAVHVWTVNDERDMRRLLEWGVDGLITDRPDRLARLLGELFGRPRPPGPPAGEAEPFLERLLRA